MAEEEPFKSVGIVGAGAWGSALSALCANNGANVKVWARDPEIAEAITTSNRNEAYLPGVDLPKGVSATSKLADLRDGEAILFVAPVQSARDLYKRLSDVFPEPIPVAICSKGIERASGRLLTEVLTEAWPSASPAVLSGPSFAKDVVRGRPTAVTLACREDGDARRWRATLARPHFRLYASDDVTGAALGGAVKNVLAIAAGVVDGAALGESARAAIIARGFTEFQRLGVAMGVKPETMGGLSGLGDLILTATSSSSRNMSLGIALGEGRPATDVLAERRTVSEGAATASAILQLAERYQVETPICRAVADLVSGTTPLEQIIQDLLSRPMTSEG